MGRNEIITELYNSKEFNDTIRKMNPQHLQDDLKSEVMLILCEKDEEELKGIYDSGGLKYYTVRIILNLIQSNTSPFYKKFRGNAVDLVRLEYNAVKELDHKLEEHGDDSMIVFYDPQYVDDYDKMLLECAALDEIENLFWYDKGIIELYLKFGTYRSVEEKTGIPWESVYKTIRKACAKIKLKVA